MKINEGIPHDKELSREFQQKNYQKLSKIPKEAVTAPRPPTQSLAYVWFNADK